MTVTLVPYGKDPPPDTVPLPSAMTVAFKPRGSKFGVSVMFLAGIRTTVTAERTLESVEMSPVHSVKEYPSLGEAVTVTLLSNKNVPLPLASPLLFWPRETDYEFLKKLATRLVPPPTTKDAIGFAGSAIVAEPLQVH